MRWSIFASVLGSLCIVLPTNAAERSVLCYDRQGRAQRCIPPFVNAAFGLTAEATNTCGLRGPTEYCLQSSIGGALKQCSYCDARDPQRAHPASFLTDFHSNDNSTWWQSDTMYEGMQYPSSVNLTLHLGKAFDITYVRLKFHSKRPESFAIYKRTTENGEWTPYQYYSASCEETYGRDRREVITRADETKAICTDEFSDISPLTGGSVAFSTLEGRPSAYDYENSAALQLWVTATDIMIVLNRMNTFGDEVFGDPAVLKSYYYSISDFAVGGRCKCSGHASECVRSTGQGLEEKQVCRCEHNTGGPNCEECLPFYNDRPWHRATALDAHECQACNCNGLSNRCFFDEDLYRRNGHGGHCIECREYTAGPNCERCKDFYYRVNEFSSCQPCNCDPTGSVTEQCDVSGQCRCKPGVTGEKCDRCQPNHFEFGPSGCRPCQCLEAGSRNNLPECVPDSGTCTCKEYVEGQNCDRCKPGYFGLNTDNSLGCLACFCYGHSSVCTSAPGYTTKVIHSEFNSGRQKWSAADRVGTDYDLEFNGVTQSVGLSAPGGVDAVYFVAPGRYLGDQRFSYNQFLTFSLRVGEEGARASVFDVIIEGHGMRISAPVFAQSNPVPRTVTQNYKFRLHEHANYQWMPVLSSMDFQKLLSNITSVKIRGTYTSGGIGFLDNVKLESARPGGGYDEVSHIEQCTCPEGYVGQFCESCAPGYHRDPAEENALARCVPCNCNGHSDVCDVNDGRCICQHNTVGENCERCSEGYYGYALAGTPDDCKPCPCPDNGPCVELLNGEVACINCKEGYVGNRCDMCGDGYHGDPTGKHGARRPCQKCTCNDNIDSNAVANCDTITGECLKCIYNSHGFNCDQCLPGYYGDALALPRGQCKACDCYRAGSDSYGIGANELVSCDRFTGQCPCLSNVIGNKCDMCLEGYWNIDSEAGCERCDCDTIGSYNRSCDIGSGQCICKPGVVGRKCDQCAQNNYGFSYEGCKACNCDPEGSLYLQCDVHSGECACRDNIEGQMCDRCMENKYNITAGCINCPVCYNLVQDAVNAHRAKLAKLREIISHIGDNPQAIDDADFRRKMAEVQRYVDELLRDAKNAIGADSTLSEQMEAMKAAVTDIMDKCGKIAEDAMDADRSSENAKIDIEEAEKAITRAEEALLASEIYIDTDGEDAIREAKEAQNKLGSQSNRMTQIAQEARELALQHEMEADTIVDLAQQALNTSQEALRVAQEALRTPGETSRDITEVRRDVSDVDRMYDETRAMAQTALDQATGAYKESLRLLSEAEALKVPTVDAASMKEEAQRIKEEAVRISEDAEELMAEQAELMQNVDRSVHEAQKLLENGEKQQQVADELLADADKARGIAKDAVAKADQTLREAWETLDTLKAFDDSVQQSKEEAEEAMKKIPAIESQIRDAEETTENAQLDLQDAEDNAIRAHHEAEEAKKIAESASDAAGEVRTDAEATKARAQSARDESDQLADLVAQAETRLEQFEQQAQEDDTLSSQALEKANQAKISAQDSSEQVGDAVETVKDILDKLDNLDDVNSAQLEELERNLQDAEDKLAAADIELRYNTLLESRQQQAMWVKDYTMELVQLRADVQNVKHINQTIPRECFKRIEIEPTEPSLNG